MARKTVEKNISYDDTRKKYYVNLDYGIVEETYSIKDNMPDADKEVEKYLPEFWQEKKHMS
ncbi:hypothetical protein D7V86_26130 [bacterium D16-51]|nr:hypothetical protein D7V96_21425 [bacterium D16-59]RKI52102.1 hypothetical protein D7V86_26130 [bacterium D16-51]